MSLLGSFDGSRKSNQFLYLFSLIYSFTPRNKKVSKTWFYLSRPKSKVNKAKTILSRFNQQFRFTKIVENGRFDLNSTEGRRRLLVLTLRFSCEVRAVQSTNIFMVIPRSNFNLVFQVPSSCRDVKVLAADDVQAAVSLNIVSTSCLLLVVKKNIRKT